MSMTGFDIVGFDLDGTLLDTRADIAAALNHALAEAGRTPLPVDRVTAMIGGGVRHLLGQALEATGGTREGEAGALLPVLIAFYTAHPCDQATIYPGARDTLAALHEAGARLGIVTNKPQAIAELTLERTGLTPFFGCVLGGDAPGIAQGKPAPDALHAMVQRLGGGRAAFVGDSRYDVAAAHAAGMPAVACRFGFASDEVDELGAEVVINRIADLPAALARL